VPQKPFKSTTCSLAVAPESTLQHDLCSSCVDDARRVSGGEPNVEGT